ncbi:hypothetical protein ACFOY2_53045 [Nonomuraea purpurea]|uniref:Uncharacterized protein n=1 Tax=Nonomuraea purpurea TaxID=1849276 RepID=A0ABV8GPV4_9ACTN
MSPLMRPYSPNSYPEFKSAFNLCASSKAGKLAIEEYLKEREEGLGRTLLPVPPIDKADYRSALKEFLEESDDADTSLLCRYLERSNDDETYNRLVQLKTSINASFYNDGRCDSMHYFSSWERMLLTIRDRLQKSGHSSAMVSLVFTHPDSLVFKDLKKNHAYFNARTGESWDLFFVGYERARFLNKWSFAPEGFNNVRREIENRHATALLGERPVEGILGWKFSGTADLVSFMVHGWDIDWLSLRYIRLLDSSGAYSAYSLAEVVEELAEWREDSPPIRDLAPGELPLHISALSLQPGLKAISVALLSGIAGNAAYEILKSVLLK